jgi:hypothetical protein
MPKQDAEDEPREQSLGTSCELRAVEADDRQGGQLPTNGMNKDDDAALGIPRFFPRNYDSIVIFTFLSSKTKKANKTF